MNRPTINFQQLDPSLQKRAMEILKGQNQERRLLVDYIIYDEFLDLDRIGSAVFTVNIIDEATIDLIRGKILRDVYVGSSWQWENYTVNITAYIFLDK